MQADHGADVDDAAVAGLDHVRQHPRGHVEDARQVRLEHGVPLFLRHLGQRAIAGDPGVVDEDVDIAAALDDAGDRPVDGRRIADVATDGVRLAPCRHDLGGDVVRVRLVVVSDVVGVIADRHGTAVSSQLESDLPADAA